MANKDAGRFSPSAASTLLVKIGIGIYIFSLIMRTLGSYLIN